SAGQPLPRRRLRALGWAHPRAAAGAAQLISGRAAFLFAILGAAPAPAPPASPPSAGDKTLAVRLEPFRFLAGAPPAGWTAASFDDRAWAGPSPGPFAPRQSQQLLAGGAEPAPPPPGVASFDAVSGQPLLLRARFAVAEARRARVLELRVAYN